LRVAHGVKGFLGTGEVAICGDAAAAWLAKVDITGQFADDQDVQARDQLGLQAGGADQLFVTNGRAEVGKQAQVFAQAQNGLLWDAAGGPSLSYFQSPTAPNSTASASLASLSVDSGSGMAVHLVGGAAYQGRFHFQFQVQNVQDLDGLGHDCGTNAVTGQYCNFHKSPNQLGTELKICPAKFMLSWGQSTSLEASGLTRNVFKFIAAYAIISWASHGFCARRWASKALILSA
jgi:hypothetical protein